MDFTWSCCTEFSLFKGNEFINWAYAREIKRNFLRRKFIKPYTRKKCTDYIEAKNEILAIDIIEKERKLNFLENEHFESEYYLTIVQLIPTDNSKKVGEIFLEYAKKSEILDKTLENFNKEFKKILNLFKEIFLEVTELDDEETYTYLHSCVSTKIDKVIVPEISYAMANYLCDSDLVGGLKPKLRGKKI